MPITPLNEELLRPQETEWVGTKEAAKLAGCSYSHLIKLAPSLVSRGIAVRGAGQAGPGSGWMFLRKEIAKGVPVRAYHGPDKRAPRTKSVKQGKNWKPGEVAGLVFEEIRKGTPYPDIIIKYRIRPETLALFRKQYAALTEDSPRGRASGVRVERRESGGVTVGDPFMPGIEIVRLALTVDWPEGRTPSESFELVSEWVSADSREGNLILSGEDS